MVDFYSDLCRGSSNVREVGVKRVNLGRGACIDITDEDFEKMETRKIIDQDTNELLYEVKVVKVGDKGLILLVPLSEFEEIKSDN